MFKRIVVAAVAALMFVPEAGSAKTYIYTGEHYDDVDYAVGPDPEDGYLLRGPYDSSMRIDFRFKIDGSLKANSIYKHLEYDVIAFHVFDGINKLVSSDPRVEFYMSLSTDTRGNITDWNFYVARNPGDGEQIRSYSAGDFVMYEYEYACCEDDWYSPWSAEEAFAETTNRGSWSVVPLPAALPLLAAGLGGLGFIGRRKKKAA